MAEAYTSASQTAAIREGLANGGPAFPHPQGWRRQPEVSDGMSLRDWFAGQALAGILANPEICNRAHALESRGGSEAPVIIATLAFEVADAAVAVAVAQRESA